MLKRSLLIGMLLIPLLLAAGLTLQIKLPVPEFDSRSNGFEHNKDYGRISSSGKWQLPQRQINVLLPPGSSRVTWHADLYSSVFIPALEPIVNPAYHNGETMLNSRTNKHTGSGVHFNGINHWGDLVYASFTVIPAFYDEVGQGYRWSGSLMLSVSFVTEDHSPNRVPPTMNNPDFFVNPQALDHWYVRAVTRNYDYLIVSTPSLYNAASSLVTYRQGQGLQVSFADINTILNTSPGANPAEKLKNHLIAEYDQQPFAYLLLVGDIGLVPTAMLTPEPNGLETVPSDFYYSDLSSNFDSDNDGRLGEYSPAPGLEDWEMDFTPELYVGRIPFNNASDVGNVCNRIVAFETATGDWKNKALLPGAIQNFQNQGGNMDWAASDAADLMQYMQNTILGGMQMVTMYEQAGILPSYPSDYSLTYDNFLNLLNTQSWGIVNWGAHGSSVSASRVWWAQDVNNNQIPDYFELQWAAFVNVNTFNNLSNSDGAVFFLGSCYNGRIDNPTICLSAQIIKKKGVGSIAATRTGWYKLGWRNPGWGGLNSYNYHWLENYVPGGMSLGGAHALANLIHTQYYLFGDPVDSGGIIWPELQNVYTYMLLGDPAIGFNGTEPVPIGEVLIWKPYGDPPFALINAINQQGSFNVIHTDKLIPDYDYLYNFDMIFCLFGYGQFVYTPEPGTMEYNLLNSYLESGGKVWMEGLINWDNNDLLLGKFGTIAPFDHLVDIRQIGFADDSGTMIWTHAPDGFWSQALTGYLPSAITVFQNVSEGSMTDGIGIYNSNGNFRTIASSFELNRLTLPDHDLSTMVSIIFDTLNVFMDEPVSITDAVSPVPGFSISAFPNPFHSNLNIRMIDLPVPDSEIEIFNLRGQRVYHHRFANMHKYQSFIWDGKDQGGRSLAHGIYFLRIRSGNQSKTLKLLHLK